MIDLTEPPTIPLPPFSSIGLQRNLMLIIFPYFNASALLHKITTLDKHHRQNIPHSALLDQKKVLRFKADAQTRVRDLGYGFKLADQIEFCLDENL